MEAGCKISKKLFGSLWNGGDGRGTPQIAKRCGNKARRVHCRYRTIEKRGPKRKKKIASELQLEVSRTHSMGFEDDDEPLTLSASTLAALQQFKAEEAERKQQFERLHQQSEQQFERRNISIDAFQEDWQLSQFWYTDETADTLARALLAGADESTVVCIASAPSVYAAVTRLPRHEVPTEHIYLLEYDERFGVMAGKDHFFVYDYNHPDDVPEVLRHRCHRLLIDPPFLEEECQTRSAQAARNLLRSAEKTASGEDQFRLISSTGERMRDIMKRTYPETRVTSFLPQHKNGLSNEFRCYASFECEHWHFDDSV